MANITIVLKHQTLDGLIRSALSTCTITKKEIFVEQRERLWVENEYMGYTMILNNTHYTLPGGSFASFLIHLLSLRLPQASTRANIRTHNAPVFMLNSWMQSLDRVLGTNHGQGVSKHWPNGEGAEEARSPHAAGPCSPPISLHRTPDMTQENYHHRP